MNYNFDEIINRRGSDSVKWLYYPEDVLPLWVADMDFISPKPVIDALQDRVAHGIFGYPLPDAQLKIEICDHLAEKYDWNVLPEEIIFLPGVVNGFNNVIHAFTQSGQGVLMQTPVYPPFLGAPGNARAIRQEAPLSQDKDGKYVIDLEAFEEAIDPNTAMFLLCNPHNPVGRVFSADELMKMAEICQKHDLMICSDEIHADIVYEGYQHIPIASLSPEISANTITLMAPSKTFNIAGLGFSFAVIQNKEYLKKVEEAQMGLVSHVNLLGYTAALAAYQDGQEWLSQLLAYLQGNRDYLIKRIHHEFPKINAALPEGTYLAWLDCRKLDLPKGPYQFFLEEAKVAFNDGRTFGTGGDGFVRLNFGCPRSILDEAFQRMKAALDRAH